MSEKFSQVFGNILAFLKRTTCDFKAVQRSALCSSRRELSNAYLLAKFGFDTAENEPSKVCPDLHNALARVLAVDRPAGVLGLRTQARLLEKPSIHLVSI